MKENDMSRLIEFDQTKTWLEKELSMRVNVSPDLSKVIFIGLTNRTNTGALATAIGKSPTTPPITRHIQPFKAIARQIMESKGVRASTPLTFFKSEIELVAGVNLIKETIGPGEDNPAEWIDSMNILLSSGVKPNQIVFIPTFRDLFDTIASWKFMWNWNLDNFPFSSLNKSLEIVSEKIELSKKLGIKIVPYVHEFIRDYKATNIIRNMSTLIGIPYDDRMVNWEVSKSKGEEDPYFAGSLIKYDQPPDRWIRGVLGSSHGGRGQLVWKPLKDGIKLTREEQEFVFPKIQPAIIIQRKCTELAKVIFNL